MRSCMSISIFELADSYLIGSMSPVESSDLDSFPPIFGFSTLYGLVSLILLSFDSILN